MECSYAWRRSGRCDYNEVPAAGGGEAAINGDFVLVGEELYPIEALRENGIEAMDSFTATCSMDSIVYSILLGQWQMGLREALDRTASAKS